jgi:hypothetical protein
MGSDSGKSRKELTRVPLPAEEFGRLERPNGIPVKPGALRGATQGEDCLVIRL